jgi:hypothetical protein
MLEHDARGNDELIVGKVMGAEIPPAHGISDPSLLLRRDGYPDVADSVVHAEIDVAYPVHQP